MTVETNANFISDLNETYPNQRDLINEGDDHIRLLKNVLKRTFPGMDTAVTPTSDKLNKLDATFAYEEDGKLGVTTSLNCAEGLTMNFGGAKLEGVGDPKDATDAVNLRSLQGNLMWPVGSVFLTIDSRNPKDILGFGTWDRFAEGRVIIGSGSTTDADNNPITIQNETKGGNWLQAITPSQLPVHNHPIANLEIKPAGGHRHGFPAGGGSDGSGGRRAIAIDIGVNGGYDWIGEWEGGTPAVNTGGEHTHEFTLDIQNAGGGEKMPMAQPWMACNIWVRKPDPET